MSGDADAARATSASPEILMTLTAGDAHGQSGND
jgi:hypothetical protein